MCDDGGEVQGSRSNMETAFAARKEGMAVVLKRVRNASHTAGWPFRSSQE